MDITPELIAEIDFPDALKGFDKDAVDDFLGQVGTELGRVRYELRKAERRVAELEEDATRASSAPAPASRESDAVKATRTIMAAEETADRIESDATAQAEKMLTEAKTEADTAVEVAGSEAKRLLADAHSSAERLEGEARREADELLVAARRRAEDEYDARVADYERVLGEQEQRSDALANDVDSLEGRVGEYRSVLERLAEEVRRVLDDPDELRFRPTLELTAPAAPTGVPAPVPGSVVPDDTGVEGDSGPTGRAEEWQPGSWSPDLEATEDGAADASLSEQPAERDDLVIDEGDDGSATDDPPTREVEQAASEPADTFDSSGADATETFDAPPASDLTGEYHEVDVDDGSGADGGEAPNQLQAFSGAVDAPVAQPYVPNNVREATGIVPQTSPGFDVADDAFPEPPPSWAVEPQPMAGGVEFVDLGDDQPGNAAFSVDPAAFAHDDEDEDQKGLRRFFGK